MSLTDFRTFGRSGLVVSPLALGTMTFGAAGWGSSADLSTAVFNNYTEAGGNFVDTADVYGSGRSEELIGELMAERKLRDRIVLATKFTFNTQPGNPNAGGNGRKNIYQALEGSLRRLKSDYVDLYWMHYWDQTTPVEEVMETFGDLQNAGKIRYFGLSDVPAWYAAKAAMLTQGSGRPNPIALQMEYSLAERSIEREHIPMAQEFGFGIAAWGPLASGFLTGKYRRDSGKPAGEGRFDSQQPFRDFTDKHWHTLDTLREVAAEIGRPPAQTALTWAASQPGISALLLGARNPEQLQANLESLEIRLTPEQKQRLTSVSALEPAHPYAGFTADVKRSIFGNTSVNTFYSNSLHR